MRVRCFIITGSYVTAAPFILELGGSAASSGSQDPKLRAPDLLGPESIFTFGSDESESQ